MKFSLATFVLCICQVVSLQLNATGTWTLTSAPTGHWSSLASDASGQNVVAVSAADGAVGGVCQSHDAGGAWAQLPIPGATKDIFGSTASSADGQVIYTTQSGSGVFASRNGGASWTKSVLQSDMTAVVMTAVSCSSDGAKVYVSMDGGNLFSSSDFGQTFKPVAGKGLPASGRWRFVAVSPLGTGLAASTDQILYLSNDSGATWTVPAALPTTQWKGATFDASGQHIYLAASPCTGGWLYAHGGLYSSADYGKTWKDATNADNLNWETVVCDSTGRYVIGANSDGEVATSTDFGKTFKKTTTPSGLWTSVASSADGSHLLAASGGQQGHIYRQTK